MTASLLGASFEAFVLDNEMHAAIYRALRGVEVLAERVVYVHTEELAAEVKQFRLGELDWTHEVPNNQFRWLQSHYHYLRTTVALLVIGGLGMAAPVTAGFGAYHWITSRGLVFVYGLPLEVGGAYAILAHESNSILTIGMGAVSYLILMLWRRKKK